MSTAILPFAAISALALASTVFSSAQASGAGVSPGTLAISSGSNVVPVQRSTGGGGGGHGGGSGSGGSFGGGGGGGGPGSFSSGPRGGGTYGSRGGPSGRVSPGGKGATSGKYAPSGKSGKGSKPYTQGSKGGPKGKPPVRWSRDHRHRFYGPYFIVPFGYYLYDNHPCYDWRYGSRGWGYYWNYARCPV